MAYSYTLTPKDIYGVEEPPIPKGYKVVGFRPVNKGENYLTDGRIVNEVFSFEVYYPGPREPRLILEKLPEKKRLLEVEHCYQCMYRNGAYCNNGQLPRLISQIGGIPSWCPLPKAP